MLGWLLWRCTGQRSPARILNAFLSAGPSASACVFAEHVFVCVCRPFSTPLGSLICFGSVWWAGHEANYLLKGKSEPNEPHRATELTGLIKHSVCITGRLPQEPTVCWISHGAACIQTLTLHLYRIKSSKSTHRHTTNGRLLFWHGPDVRLFVCLKSSSETFNFSRGG